MEVLLSVFDLSHIETPDTRYLVVAMDHSGRLPLGFGENNISEFLAGRNHSDSLKIILIGHTVGL